MDTETTLQRDETIRKLYRVIRQVRSCFNEMRAFADTLHADLGINSSVRAVLEHLAGTGAQTVPDIARGRSVTRQHVQQLADALVAEGLAEFVANPAHKRSQFVRLTTAGERAFAEITRREQEHLAAIAAGFSDAELDQAISVLRRLRERLGQQKAQS